MLEVFIEVESFKFADIVKHWARERLVHEVLIARELAEGVLRQGLRFNSVDPKWTRATVELRAAPLIGYVVRGSEVPLMLRAEALEHLEAVADERCDYDARLLSDEFVRKDDFRRWLIATGRAMPAFWFDGSERATPR